MARQRMLVCTVAAALLGCGESTGGGAPVATVTVTPALATVQVGSTVQLTAALEDADGNQLSGRAVTWSSNAGGTAGVDADGLVTGVGVGSATITATSEGRSATAGCRQRGKDDRNVSDSHHVSGCDFSHADSARNLAQSGPRR